MLSPATVTIGLSPTFDLGPLSLTWHGTMVTVGILAGGCLAVRFARERRLEPNALTAPALVLLAAGLVGARLLYLLENDVSALGRPGAWTASAGFSVYGALLLGVPAAALMLRPTGRIGDGLDAFAIGFPLGVALGRIGDLVIGAHYGARTDAPWGFAYASPSADVPVAGVGYVSGASVEIVGAFLIFAVIWSLRRRFVQPGMLLCTVIASYSAMEFLAFFLISERDKAALGLQAPQGTSLVLLAASLSAIAALRHRARAADGQTGHPTRMTSVLRRVGPEALCDTLPIHPKEV